jgi:steroid delta-isomerase-like uncharacterized protein
VSAEENKLLMRRHLEVMNERNLALLDETMAPDYVSHDEGNPMQGREMFKQYISMYLTAFPDLRVTIDEQIAEGDMVATRATFRGTHLGELMGVPPTGRPVNATSLLISRISGGRLTEEWIRFDTMNLMQQLGVLPAPSPATG